MYQLRSLQELIHNKANYKFIRQKIKFNPIIHSIHIQTMRARVLKPSQINGYRHFTSFNEFQYALICNRLHTHKLFTLISNYLTNSMCLFFVSRDVCKQSVKENRLHFRKTNADPPKEKWKWVDSVNLCMWSTQYVRS